MLYEYSGGVPRGPDGEAAQDAASLLAGITLPSIEPFGSDNAELVGLPALALYPLPEPGSELGLVVESPSVLSVAEGFVMLGLRRWWS
ncbi:hypothetical protein NHF46_17525 [Arthrobacter alpinus]|nr:hypothetical protein [Arthrobacter alpinus]